MKKYKKQIVLIIFLLFLCLFYLFYFNKEGFTSSKSNDVIFITLTNTGYLDYTFNCLKSLEKINFNGKLHNYCIGEEGYKKLKQSGYSSYLIDDNKNSKMQKFRQKNWSNIVYYKFEIIHKHLLKYKYVCFTDGDIVYENKNFLNYLINNIGDNELLIQNDTMDDNNTNNLCSGFMFIKSTPNTISLFNPNNVKSKLKEGWGDQLYINEIKHKMKYKTLPLKLFPNGKYYYENKNIISPYLIHFNWIVGNEKKNKMIEHNKWYI